MLLIFSVDDIHVADILCTLVDIFCCSYLYTCYYPSLKNALRLIFPAVDEVFTFA